ncbi:alpha-2-macroglobulin family protein [Shimia sp. CNT1-13L.2]|uniref:alpha-2-macroglobulin family protein n=1 Tax=Shimia sp. CNT1-13L.2 TaxID=2959663 RepID=UPI0020CE6459|nr:alpha-2-macroglobulin family protein [Shimia sp. CNT1-13L.2]MCP9481018.1 alpha-2-macroglobulin family protein [Shimia sp. CNT1-13L.2]
MRWLFMAVAGLFIAHSSIAQEQVVPERRAVLSFDVDFYGADLTQIFDTTLDACIKACTDNTQCKAFTFNSRANACFPKTEISDRQPYEGAYSAEVFETPAATMTLAQSRAADLTFLRPNDFANALKQAQTIGRTHGGGPWSVLDMVQTAQDRRAGGDVLNAMRWTGAAVGKSDVSDLWLEYARLNQELKTTGENKSLHTRRAFQASINAYLRAPTDPARVSALMLMSDLFVEDGQGRRALSALRLAESIQPRDDVIAALDDVVAKYGFRINEHTVENNLAQPRICADFNEPLVKAGVDYTTYLRLPDQRLAVEAEERRICIDGVEHGNRYTLTFRKGLPAASGETLARDTDLTFYVRDRAASVNFPGRAYVLPRTADAGLPIETVNLDTVELHLQRVSDRNLLRAIQDNYFGQPLSYWQLESFSNEVAESVWRGEGEVQNTLNADMTTRLPMGDIISGLPAGVYALTADLPGADKYDETGATQWFVLSDLGATTFSGADGLHVFVRSLADTSALPDTKITLLSRANRVLGTSTTDTRGYARFDAGLTRGSNAAAPAMVLLQKGDDFSFLSLTDPAFDLSDRGVEGRPPAPPVDVFLTTDRGAYRAGETIHATALVRGDVAQALPDLPVTAILTRPDGVEYKRLLSNAAATGGHVFALPLGSTVPRGTWKLAIKADTEAAPLATQKLLVEDFLPERIDFDVTLPDAPFDLQSGEPVLPLEARYLFGAPGAGFRVEGQVTLRARETVKGYEAYRFGRYDERFNPRTEYFSATNTDANGLTDIFLPVPDTNQRGRPFQADITTRVYEGSGRPVERRVSHPATALGPMIGIRPLFGEDVVREGTQAAFHLVGLSPTLDGAPMKVRWSLNRIRTHYQWYNQYGNWAWEPITRRTTVASGDTMIDGTPTEISANVDWGRYELVVERLDGDYVASATDFYAGWYAPADATQTPDTLEVSLDKPGYHSGDTATLRLVPRYAGTALISVMSNRLIAMKAVEVSEGENLIPLDVTDEWGAGAYVTASVIRPADAPAGMNPARALGLSYARIDPGAKQLSVSLDTPDQIAPRGPLTVGITVDGVTQGDTAHVTLAAVDVGILNITGFQSPDPSEHYFGQRRLGMDIRDLYGRLIDGMNGNMGALRSGGDAGSSSSFESPPPTEELVAYFQGPVTIGPDGKASVTFDIPEFNGTVRLMAVAWSDTGVGQAEADVLVRDPVVVTATLPRFIAPGDETRLLLEIAHLEGPSGRMGLDVSSGGITLAGQIPSGLTLDDGDTTRLTIPLTASTIGDHSLRIALTTPDGMQLVKSLTLPVRANDPEISVTQRLSLAAGATFTLDDNLFANFRPGTGAAVLSAGALAHFDAPGLLQSLDRYPYGCTEQITSKALPLLYFDTITSALGLGERDRIQERIDQSIAKVLTRQSSNGAFGLWYPDTGDMWLDAYVSDFLSRARAKGYAVPQTAFRTALDNLRNRINYAPDFDQGGGDVAYALMVLAREGAANMGDLRYYADVKADAFTTPLAAAQLGAALAFYGDQTRADRMFAKAYTQMEDKWQDAPRSYWRADYGTHLRDTAGLLTLAVEAGSERVDRNRLSARLGGVDRSLSTQESVWSLLAAHALLTDETSNTLSVNGTPQTGPLIRALADDTADAPLAIRNDGKDATRLTLTSIGVPDYPVEKGGYGYSIDRSYYTTEGLEVDPATIKTGDRLVTVLRISPISDTGARLMINDPLPAGFEIDNPNLLSSGDIKSLDWLKPANAQNAEFRSDRFLAAVDWTSRNAFELAYVVRAISPGSFHHPAASVEDMYRPQYRANTAAGRIVISD